MLQRLKSFVVPALATCVMLGASSLAFADDPVVNPLGDLNITTKITSMGTELGTVILAAIAIMFAVFLVWSGIRWARRAVK